MFPGFSRGFLSLVALFVVLFTAVQPANARWQCVTYARSVSDIEIRGNAHTWWASAAGVYERGSTPQAGSVMVMRSHGRMRLGHVAMVREVVNDRQIRLNHANWSRRGMVEADVLAEDVSPNNDWSMVRVWHSPSGQLGLTSYPVYGFIYPNEIDAEPEVRMAATEVDANRALLASYSATPGGDRIASLD